MSVKPNQNFERFSYDFAETSPSMAVVEAISAVTGTDPLDLDPLSETLDPGSLNELLASGSDVTVSFAIEELDITVTSDGKISIRSD